MQLPLIILIADDEPEARKLILHYLKETNISFKAFEAENGFQAIDMIYQKNPDILFLDIKMPGINGLEVLKKTTLKTFPAIIFTTAFDEYALPAFEHDAVDYLLKPFERTRFEKAMDKAVRYVNTIRAEDENYIQRIPVKTGTRSLIIQVSDVHFFQAKGTYVIVSTGSDTHLITATLYELENALKPSDFVRVHRSFIVNLHMIREITSIPNGDYIIHMTSGRQVRGSRSYKPKLKSIL